MEVVQLAVKYLNHMNEVARDGKKSPHSNSPTVHVCDFMKLSEEDRMKEFNRGFNESINQTVQYLTKHLGVKSGSTLVVRLVNHLLANLESINACANVRDEHLTSGDHLHSSERLPSGERLEIDIASTPVESAQLLSSPPPVNPDAVLTCPVIRREVSTQTPSFHASKTSLSVSQVSVPQVSVPQVSVPSTSVSQVSVPSTSVPQVSDGKQTLLVTNNHSSNETPISHQSNETLTFHQHNETSICYSMGTRIRDSSKETPINSSKETPINSPKETPIIYESPETLIMNKDFKPFRFWRVQEEQTPNLNRGKRTPTSIETQLSVSSESNVDKKRKLTLPSLVDQNQLINETQVDEKLINEKLTNEKAINEELINEKLTNEKTINEKSINETPIPKAASLSCSESLSPLSSVSSYQSVSPSVDTNPNRTGSESIDVIPNRTGSELIDVIPNRTGSESINTIPNRTGSESINTIPNRTGSEAKDRVISNAYETLNQGVSNHEKVSKCLAFKKSITLRYQTQIDETSSSNGEVAQPRRMQTSKSLNGEVAQPRRMQTSKEVQPLQVSKESLQTLQKLASMQNHISIPSIKSSSTEHAQQSTLRTLLSDHSSSNLAPNHSQPNQTQSHQVPIHRDASLPKHFPNSTPTHPHHAIYHQNQGVAQSMMNLSTAKSRSDPLIAQSKNDSLIARSRNDPSSRSAPTSVINDALKIKGWEYSPLMSNHQRPCCPHATQTAPPHHHLITNVRHPFSGVRSHPYPMPPHLYYHRQAPCLIMEANQQMNLNQLVSMRRNYQPLHHTHLSKAKTLESKYFNQSNQCL